LREAPADVRRHRSLDGFGTPPGHITTKEGHMRRFVISLVATCSIVVFSPGGALASPEQPTRGSALINTYQRQVLGTSESDPWLFDDGCIGGTSHRDPAFIVVPLTDPAPPTSTCTIDRHATLVVVPDGATCFGDVAAGDTLADTRTFCEADWADPSKAVVEHHVVVDGKARRTKQYRTSGEFTFPAGALFADAGTLGVYYGITDAVVLDDLSPGRHTIFVSYRYADGLNGATTFTVTVTR
jgi:hypothetical protein